MSKIVVLSMTVALALTVSWAAATPHINKGEAAYGANVVTGCCWDGSRQMGGDNCPNPRNQYGECEK